MARTMTTQRLMSGEVNKKKIGGRLHLAKSQEANLSTSRSDICDQVCHLQNCPLHVYVASKIGPLYHLQNWQVQNHGQPSLHSHSSRNHKALLAKQMAKSWQKWVCLVYQKALLSKQRL